MGWDPLMNPIMFYQNYHVVHHVRPRIPLYLWVKACNETEADYLDRAVPIRTAEILSIAVDDNARTVVALRERSLGARYSRLCVAAWPR